MKLWLDDVRPPARYGRIGWHWAKTYEEAVAALETGLVVEASLDHDLSEMATIGQLQPGEKTGYSVVCWMEEHGVWPARVTVHSLNPSGSKRMFDVCDRFTVAVLAPARL